MDITEIAGALGQCFKGSLEPGKSLADLTSFRIGGPAGLIATPKGFEDLKLITQEIASSGIELLVLGRGSNVLISDKGFPGVVLVLGEGFNRIKRQGQDKVNVEAGCELNRLVAWTIERDLVGLESLAGIPGSLGGAVRMNAGAQGCSIGDSVEEISVLRLDGREVRDGEIAAERIGFAYRKTGLEDNEIIYKVKLKLSGKGTNDLEARRKDVLRRRRENQPLAQPSAGSVFRNPEGISAGELIDRCGLKGKSVGGAMVSEKHANFIVNIGGATARDVYELMTLIKQEVRRREGVELIEEIRLVGDMGGG
jgi:UDP-N-acetylmuramate dehydrogenase